MILPLIYLALRRVRSVRTYLRAIGMNTTKARHYAACLLRDEGHWFTADEQAEIAAMLKRYACYVEGCGGDAAASEQGSYALYPLATPNDGDQTVEIFRVVDSRGYPETDLTCGWYWQQLPDLPPSELYDSEQQALDGARAHYGYGPLSDPE